MVVVAHVRANEAGWHLRDCQSAFTRRNTRLPRRRQSTGTSHWPLSSERLIPFGPKEASTGIWGTGLFPKLLAEFKNRQFGAGDRIRPHDPNRGKVVLYP